VAPVPLEVGLFLKLNGLSDSVELSFKIGMNTEV
jgi:hypothetical protein